MYTKQTTVLSKVIPAVPGNVTMDFRTFWNDKEAYTEINCTVDDVTSGATVNWQTENCSVRIESSVQEKSGVITNAARLAVLSYAGCTVICVVEQMGLDEPIKKSLHIPLTGTYYMHHGPSHITHVFWSCDFSNDLR